jgi:hypothetical protein
MYKLLKKLQPMNPPISDTPLTKLFHILVGHSADLPQCLQGYKEVKGIWIGGCIEGAWGDGGLVAAHAHSFREDPYCGWICSPYRWVLDDQDILLHELAHILSEQDHNFIWKGCLMALGGDVSDYAHIEMPRRPWINKKIKRRLKRGANNRSQ